MGVGELHGVMTSRVVVLVGRGEGLKGGRSVELRGGGNGSTVMARVCARVEKSFPFYSRGNEGSECSRSISNDPILLHKHTTESSTRRIAINIIGLGVVELS